MRAWVCEYAHQLCQYMYTWVCEYVWVCEYAHQLCQYMYTCIHVCIQVWHTKRYMLSTTMLVICAIHIAKNAHQAIHAWYNYAGYMCHTHSKEHTPSDTCLVQLCWLYVPYNQPTKCIHAWYNDTVYERAYPIGVPAVYGCVS